jgi:hypothetical protein
MSSIMDDLGRALGDTLSVIFSDFNHPSPSKQTPQQKKLKVVHV